MGGRGTGRVRMSDPEGLRLTQAESVPVPAARTAPPLPPLGEGGASSAQSSGKLQLALEALCLSTSLCFCLCHCLSLSPSVFLYISLSLSLLFPACQLSPSLCVSLCFSVFLCLLPILFTLHHCGDLGFHMRPDSSLLAQI